MKYNIVLEDMQDFVLASCQSLEIAEKYGLVDSLAIDENTVIDLSDETGKADYDEIIATGELVIGYTIFAPIAYVLFKRK